MVFGILRKRNGIGLKGLFSIIVLSFDLMEKKEIWIDNKFDICNSHFIKQKSLVVSCVYIVDDCMWLFDIQCLCKMDWVTGDRKFCWEINKYLGNSIPCRHHMPRNKNVYELSEFHGCFQQKAKLYRRSWGYPCRNVNFTSTAHHHHHHQFKYLYNMFFSNRRFETIIQLCDAHIQGPPNFVDGVGPKIADKTYLNELMEMVFHSRNL